MRDHFVTNSGARFTLARVADWRDTDRDAHRYQVRTRSADGTESEVIIDVLDASEVIDHLPAWVNREERASELVALATESVYDGMDQLPVGSDGSRFIDVSPSRRDSLFNRPRVSDREIRRYIARRAYDMFQRINLGYPVVFDWLDLKQLGIEKNDLYRQAELLEADGYLEIDRKTDGLLVFTSKAAIVRDVERYGAARGDVATEIDYLAALKTYDRVGAYAKAIELEYRRFTHATSDVEVRSVFRAVTPLIEGIIKDLLTALGSAKQPPTMGPAIAELQSRGVPQSLLSQLSMILKTSRDIEQHGGALPMTVLQFACLTSFEIVPQLAALFPYHPAV